MRSEKTERVWLGLPSFSQFPLNFPSVFVEPSQWEEGNGLHINSKFVPDCVAVPIVSNIKSGHVWVPSVHFGELMDDANM